MKKIIAVCAVILFCFMTFLPLPVKALVSGDYEYEIIEGEGCSITNYYGDETDIVIPSFLDGHVVTTIGFDSFREKGITSVEFPNTVEYIMDWSFYGNNITSVNFPETGFWLGICAFTSNQITTVDGQPHNGLFFFHDSYGWDFTKISSYGGTADVIDFIPDTVELIGDRTFLNCGLTSVTVPSSVKTIGIEAFDVNEFTHFMLPENTGPWAGSDGNTYNGGDMVDVRLEYVINDNFTYIDNGDGTCTIDSYTGTETEIYIPGVIDGLIVESIADYTFQNRGITAVSFPVCLKYIGDYAFEGNKLLYVQVSYNAERLGEFAFANNDIETVIFHASLSEIGKGAFNNNEITSVDYEPSNGLIYGRKPDGLFWQTDTSVVVSYGGKSNIIDFLNDDLIVIGDSAFKESRIANVNLPNSLMIAGNDSFSGNYITDIIFPSTMAFIGDGAFGDNLLTQFTLPNGTLNWAGDESDQYDYLPGQTVDANISYLRFNDIPNRKAGVAEVVEGYVYKNEYYDIDLSTVFEDINNDNLIYTVSYDGGSYFMCNEIISERREDVGTYEMMFIANDRLDNSEDTYTIILHVECGPDVNDDGAVDMLDIIEISKHYHTEYPDYEQTRDNYINMFDIVKVAKWVE